MNLDGRIAVITGGASGIGRATVETLAEAGARVFTGDIDADRGAAAAEEARARGLNVTFQPLDVTDDDSVTAFAGAVHAQVPAAHVVVNVAGGADNVPFLDTGPESWRRDTEINFLGTVRVTHAFLAPMAAAGGGKIVNVASDAGRVGSTGETVYAGAKGGVIAFTKSLAREVARQGICVNCVCPGPTETPLLMSRPEKMIEALRRAIPLRRFAAPQDIADAILFFASGRSDYITGQVLSVSGGLTMCG